MAPDENTLRNPRALGRLTIAMHHPLVVLNLSIGQDLWGDKRQSILRSKRIQNYKTARKTYMDSPGQSDLEKLCHRLPSISLLGIGLSELFFYCAMSFPLRL